jgi:hypothetical protein
MPGIAALLLSAVIASGPAETVAGSGAASPATGTSRSAAPALPAAASDMAAQFIQPSTVAASGDDDGAITIVSTPPTPVPTTANPDNDHLFTVGDIEVPQGGEPGEVSVVLGNVIDPDHLLLIIRNGRDVPVYDISVVLIGTDASGGQVTAEFFIPTGGLAPGEWIFGSNAIETAGLDELADVQLRFDASEQPGLFLALEVTSAELRGDVIVGSVTNSGNANFGDFNVVSVACFNESQPTDFTAATLDVPTLRTGESAQFTTGPIDPTSCTSFAVYAVGVAQGEATSS